MGQTRCNERSRSSSYSDVAVLEEDSIDDVNDSVGAGDIRTFNFDDKSLPLNVVTWNLKKLISKSLFSAEMFTKLWLNDIFDII